MNSAQLPNIDIVIIGRNEGLGLVSAIESAKKELINYFNNSNSIPPVIYVDGNSYDDSRKIAEFHGAQTSIVEGPPTAAAGRNQGAALSNAEYIFFMDGDMEIHKDWLAAAVTFLENNKNCAAAVGYLDWETIQDGNVIWSTKNYRGISSTGKMIFGNVGGAIIFRRSDLILAGNWNRSLPVSEEFELYLRILAIGKKIVTLQTPMAIHRDKKSNNAKNFLKRNIFSKNIFIPGQVVFNAKKNRTVLMVIFRSYWVFFAHLILSIWLISNIISLTSEVSKQEIIKTIGSLTILVLLHFYYKKGNLGRTIVSMIMMNFYSIAFMLGIFGISSIPRKFK